MRARLNRTQNAKETELSAIGIVDHVIYSHVRVTCTQRYICRGEISESVV